VLASKGGIGIAKMISRSLESSSAQQAAAGSADTETAPAEKSLAAKKD
jgi:Rod binding domain-containing protein